MKAQICSFFFVLILIFSCAQEQDSRGHVDQPIGPFLGIDVTEKPKLLFPGIISTRKGEYNGTFNPEGTEFYYTTSVLEYDVLTYMEMKEDGNWSLPEIASFSAPYHEFDPLFAPDGKRLYYSSHRPVHSNNNSDTCNIWYVEKTESGWGDPQYVDLPGPSPGNYHSSIASSGNIYFNIWNTGNLFLGIETEDGYNVESLGDVINSKQGDGDPFIAADESYIIFRSYRPGGIGSGDFWISFQADGEWKEPINLGEPINSKWNEMCPYVTTDGKLFIFSSGRVDQSYYGFGIEKLSDIDAKLDSHDNGQQNIYVMSAGFIDEMRKEYFDE